MVAFLFLILFLFCFFAKAFSFIFLLNYIKLAVHALNIFRLIYTEELVDSSNFTDFMT